MAKITLTYDARNSLAKKTLEYVLSLGVFKKESTPTESDTLAIKGIKSGMSSSNLSKREIKTFVDSLR